MDTFQTQIQEATKDITLSTQERVLLRAGLVEYMNFKPIRTVTSRKSGLAWNLPFSFFRVQHLSGALIIALVVASGSVGVSYAASDALPGDLLYKFKVDVNEEVKTALLTNNEDRLNWERERAELRLEEASQLAAEGRLDAELTSEVAERFAEHADAVVVQVRAVENTDPFLAAEVADEFENALDTHEAVLARLSVEQEPTAGDDTRNLVEQVHTAAVEVAKVRNQAEEQIAADIVLAEEQTPETIAPEVAGTLTTETESVSAPDEPTPSAHMRENALLRAQARAEEQLERVEALLAESESTLPLVTESRTKVDENKQKFENARQSAVNGDLSVAYRVYREVAGTFQSIAQMLEVHRMFSIELPSSAGTSEEAPSHVPGVDIEQVRADTEDAIMAVRTAFVESRAPIDQIGETVNTHLKDASASYLRGEIAQTLGEVDSARRFYKEAQRASVEARALLDSQEASVPSGESVDTASEPQEVEEAAQVPVTPVDTRVSIIERYVEGVRVFEGTVAKLTCATVTPNIVAGAAENNISLVLSSVISATEACDPLAGDATFTISTTTAGDTALHTVLLDGTEETFTVTFEDASTHSSGTEDSIDEGVFNATNGVFKRVFRATQELLTPAE